MLILATTGRKSGQQRRIPLLHIRDVDDWIVATANGGRDDPPAWWLNLQAQPEAAIQIRGTIQRVRAEVVDAADRDHFWAGFVEIFPRYEKYTQSTSRAIPVVQVKAI